MRKEFELPDIGEGVAEGELVAWRVDVGDHVAETLNPFVHQVRPMSHQLPDVQATSPST